MAMTISSSPVSSSQVNPIASLSQSRRFHCLRHFGSSGFSYPPELQMAFGSTARILGSFLSALIMWDRRVEPIFFLSFARRAGFCERRHNPRLSYCLRRSSPYSFAIFLAIRLPTARSNETMTSPATTGTIAPLLPTGSSDILYSNCPVCPAEAVIENMKRIRTRNRRE